MPVTAANYSEDEPIYALARIYERSVESLLEEGYRVVKIEVREV